MDPSKDSGNMEGTDNAGYMDDNENKTRRPRRQRKKEGTEVAKENNENNVEEKGNDPKVENDTPKKRRRKRRDKDDVDPVGTNVNTDGGLAVYLEDLQDDIEMRAQGDVDIPTIQSYNPEANKPGGISHLGDSVFVEGTRRFREQNHDKFIRNKLRKEEEVNDDRILFDGLDGKLRNELLECTTAIEQRFRVVTTFLHGIFGGWLFMHAILVLMMTSTSHSTAVQIQFISMYLPMQRPFFVMFYLMFIFVSISLWDRLNVGQSEERTYNRPQVGILIALILMFVAFLIQNAIYYTDVVFVNFGRNQSDPVAVAEMIAVLPVWRILLTVVGVLVSLAWFAVAMIPTYDGFYESMCANLNY